MNMDLTSFRRPVDVEHMQVPVQLFLTDFTSSPTNHPVIELNFKVDCESTTPTSVFPDKPQDFGNYVQFTDWLSQGYFTNQVKITYDFQVDVQKSAPSLAQHLFALSPNGYHFIGTHLVNNAKITPDDCSPKVSYVSQRGNTNTTTVTLGGILYLNKKPYPIDNHNQVLPHRIIEEKVFKEDTKKFYTPHWITYSGITAKITYEEFPNNLIQNWPLIPSEIYSVLQQQPEVLKEEIKHLACFDGSTGENIDIIATDRKFLIFSEEARKKQPIPHEAIVMDGLGKYYITRYRNITLEREEAEAERIRLSIPLVAQGHEAIYQRFLKGALIYRPQEGSDIGMITMPIADLTPPLGGTFNLSRCGDTGKYLSISTGYKKVKKEENANKVEIWFAPRFLIEKELQSAAAHFKDIFPYQWPSTAPVGIFWTWGGKDEEVLSSNAGMDYLTTQNMDQLSKQTLREKWEATPTTRSWSASRKTVYDLHALSYCPGGHALSNSVRHFHIHF